MFISRSLPDRTRMKVIFPGLFFFYVRVINKMKLTRCAFILKNFINCTDEIRTASSVNRYDRNKHIFHTELNTFFSNIYNTIGSVSLSLSEWPRFVVTLILHLSFSWWHSLSVSVPLFATVTYKSSLVPTPESTYSVDDVSPVCVSMLTHSLGGCGVIHSRLWLMILYKASIFSLTIDKSCPKSWGKEGPPLGNWL